MVDELFAVEREAKTWDQLRQLRESKSRPIVARIKAWLEEKNLKYLLDEDEMGKSIRYILGNWSELTMFLDDIRVPLSNNCHVPHNRSGVGPSNRDPWCSGCLVL